MSAGNGVFRSTFVGILVGPKAGVLTNWLWSFLNAGIQVNYKWTWVICKCPSPRWRLQLYSFWSLISTLPFKFSAALIDLQKFSAVSSGRTVKRRTWASTVYSTEKRLELIVSSGLYVAALWILCCCLVSGLQVRCALCYKFCKTLRGLKPSLFFFSCLLPSLSCLFSTMVSLRI